MADLSAGLRTGIDQENKVEVSYGDTNKKTKIEFDNLLNLPKVI